MDNTDPAIKSLVCDACWDNVFSTDAWQALLAGGQAPGQTGSPEGFTYKTSWAAIQAAADGCNWCRLFARPKSAATEGGSEVVINVVCAEYSDCTPTGKKLVVNGQGQCAKGGSWYHQYYMYTRSDDRAAKFVNARDRITDVSTIDSYKLALECLVHCVNHHRVKCPAPQGTRLPDRVVDCSDVKHPKIVETDSSQRDFYLALSYVWGKDPQPITTNNNLKERKQGLDILSFPQTIQDAVEVTHSIGQRYLWIDALCIIQDSDEDRKRQLAQMRDIYRNTYLTINVACAKGVYEGFLRRDRPQKVPNARIPYRCPDRSVGSVWIAKPMDTDTPDTSRSYWDELEPINYRGWCLQEKLLAPRSLIYASDTLKYFCQTETVNIGGALCEPSTVMRLPNTIYKTPASISEADQVTYREAWLSVIFMYTLREITVPSDKLVALAGVAEQFNVVYEDRYLAGLWGKTLVLDLLWSAGDIRSRPDWKEDDGEIHPPDQKFYRAPSWSWASIDGVVQVSYAVSELTDNVDPRRVEILGCHVKLASEENPFGEVIEGTLKLKGLVQQVVLDGYHVQLVGKSQEPINIGLVSFDAEEERPKNAYVVPLVWDPLGSFSVGIVVVKVVNAAGEDQPECRRVGKFTSASRRAGSKDNNWLEGLREQEIVLV